MLLEFSVANYLSVRDRQVLSLVASRRDREHPGNFVSLSLPGLGEVHVLKSLALYGPNASGKSNVLRALHFMDSFVQESATRNKPSAPIGTTPFLLDKSSRMEPSEFETVFVLNDVRYQYGFSVTAHRVESEWLYSFPEGRTRKLYVRMFDEEQGTYIYETGTHFAIDAKLQDLTRPNALFLSVGAQFNHDELKEVYGWFDRKLNVLGLAATSSGIDLSETAATLLEVPELRDLMVRLLSSADLGIVDVLVEKGELERDNGKAPWSDTDSEYGVSFRHKATEQVSGSELHMDLDYKAESAGTQRLFCLAGPFFLSLMLGRCECIDELGASLHTLLSRRILKMFNDAANRRGAQLIFTTHDVTLLDSDLMRRDQVWFVEKNREGGTELYPLTRYRPRKEEALQKGYLAGRYGAIPFFAGHNEGLWEEHALQDEG